MTKRNNSSQQQQQRDMVELSSDDPQWDEESYEDVRKEQIDASLDTELVEQVDAVTVDGAAAVAAGTQKGKTDEIPKPKGEDSVVYAKVSLEDLFSGTTLKLPVERTVCAMAESSEVTCASCGGRGSVVEKRQDPTTGELLPNEQKCVMCHGQGTRVKEPRLETKKINEEVPVEIKPGMRNGHCITVSGMGDESTEHSAGDLQVILEEIPHPVFKRKNENDLVAAKEVSQEEAANGVEWKLTLLDQKEITVRAGPEDIAYSQAGAHIIRKIPDAGMPGDIPSINGSLEVIFHVRQEKDDTKPRKPTNKLFRAVKALGVGISSPIVDKGLGITALGVSATAALSSLFGDSAIEQCKNYEATDNPRVFVSGKFGGSGGGVVDHGPNQPKIEKLVLFDDGHVVRAIDVYYKGKSMMSIGNYTEGAVASHLTLEEDEYICFVKVRSNRYVQELTFGTNRGKALGPCGGKGWLPVLGRDTIGYETLVLGDPSFRLCGFRGTVGRRLDSIAFYLECLESPAE